MSDSFIVSVMGESQIETFNVQTTNKRDALQVPYEIEDQLNWLGSMLDLVAEENLTYEIKEDIKFIAESFVLETLDTDAQGYVLLLILREKWPVGQKSKFKAKADRVSANHTYIAHICEPQPMEPFPNENDLKNAEDSALASQLPFFKKNKKRFANSSALHEFIRQKR